MENSLTSPADLEIRAAQAEVVTWQEREALRLENGLALIPGYRATGASVGVLIGAAEVPTGCWCRLRVSEPFGWGLALAARGEGEGLRWLPVELG